MSLPRPTCKVCGHEVDSIEEEVDDDARTLTFVVRCHGERERVRLLEGEARGINLGDGVAFRDSPRRLGGAAR